MRNAALLGVMISFASPSLAEDFSLAMPVDCTLGEDCYIQQYMDRDEGSGFTDFQCHNLSYDGHKGTDFALPTLAAMERGVDVLAAADGVVRGTRNSMPDTGYTPETAEAVKGRECGNGAVLVHDGGWETQYCHLKEGTVTVARGQTVKAGDVLGQIGLSGHTEFPHVHLSVRKDGEKIDPFDISGNLTCDTGDDVSLWESSVFYQPGGVVEVGFIDRVPEFEEVLAGTASSDRFVPDAPAMVIYGLLFGLRAGDVVRLSIDGPNGPIDRQERTVDRNRAQVFRAVGKRLGQRGQWDAGQYLGRVSLVRDGEVINTRETLMRVGE